MSLESSLERPTPNSDLGGQDRRIECLRDIPVCRERWFFGSDEINQNRAIENVPYDSSYHPAKVEEGAE